MDSMTAATVRRPDVLQLRCRPATAASLTALAVAGVTVGSWTLSSDGRTDDVAVALSQLPWPVFGAVSTLLVLTTLHYVWAACALRAVSDRRLTLRTTTYVQLAAAATNRLVPNGVGGAGVNLRYLLRVGLVPGAAASALTFLAVAGAASDAAYATAVTSAGPAVGVNGAANELQLLAQNGLTASRYAAWVLLGVLVVAVVLVLRRLGAILSGLARGVRQALTHARAFATQPGRVGTALLTSALTTAVMSLGFVVAVDTWGHASTPLPAGALVAVYLVGSAVGGATPLPPFLGVTEAALVAGLAFGGYSSSSAVVSVVVFRLITYWLPLPVGIAMARRLRAESLL
jgi:uncharacterized membrane protein YbhN (UPF0104 family)